MNLKIHFYVLAETGRPRWNQDGGFERVWEKNSQFNNENYTKIEEGQKKKKKPYLFYILTKYIKTIIFLNTFNLIIY